MEQLADIDTTNKELISRSKTHIPSADIIVNQLEEGISLVSVGNITGVPNHIDNVRLAIWADENKEDIQYIMMDKGKNETYTLSLENNKYWNGRNCYYIEFFVLEGTGMEYSIGEKQIIEKK